MPNGASKKVKARAEEVAKLMRANGCITTRAVVAVGYSRAQAESALKHLASVGLAHRVKVGRIVMWCSNRELADAHVEMLKTALHRLICAAGVKYVSPVDVLEMAARDKEVRRLFTRYVNLSPKDTAALHLLNGLLAAMYGKPAFRKRGGTMPLYFANCGKKSALFFGDEKHDYSCG